jgi:hypothetical protein
MDTLEFDEVWPHLSSPKGPSADDTTGAKPVEGYRKPGNLQELHHRAPITHQARTPESSSARPGRHDLPGISDQCDSGGRSDIVDSDALAQRSDDLRTGRLIVDTPIAACPVSICRAQHLRPGGRAPVGEEVAALIIDAVIDDMSDDGRRLA